MDEPTQVVDRRLPVRRGALRAVCRAGGQRLPLPDVPEGHRRAVRRAGQARQSRPGVDSRPAGVVPQLVRSPAGTSAPPAARR